MLGIVLSCLAAYYFYSKSYILQRKVEFLEYQMFIMHEHLHKPSAPLLTFED
jgi:hypothetical protein